MAENRLVFITVLIGQAEGLPNITGYFEQFSIGSLIDNGAIVNTKDTSYKSNSTPTTVDGKGMMFDASRSSSIYGNSTHVTPSNLTIKIWQRIS